MSTDLLEDWIDLVTVEEARRLKREAETLRAAGHDSDCLSIDRDPISGERKIVVIRRHRFQRRQLSAVA